MTSENNVPCSSSVSNRKLAIVLLGAPNDDQGNLLQIARERCEKALEESRKHPDALILPTGGFGDHFNTTDKPHAFYTRRWLISQGVGEERFLAHAESRNTVEDGEKARPILESAGVTDIIIVTSDFHVARARLCFEHALKGTGIVMAFSPSVTRLSEEELAKLSAHETQSIAWLTEKWGA